MPEVAVKSGRQLARMNSAEAIRDALRLCLERNPATILIGEGVPDPKAIFGTTAGLREAFGPARVFDMPLSENGMTGICIGAALDGLRPIMVHQRIDFALLAMDQLVNNAAKWHYLFAGQATVPLVVRTIIGRGWGQGPQHAQSLQASFAHIPGLKVVMPVFPEDAKGMLCAAVADDNPVLFIEHRWIHYTQGAVPVAYYESDLQRARVCHEGSHISVAAFSYMVIEALQAARALAKYGIELEVIDMRSVRPLDTESVLSSVAKTGRLLVADTAHKSFGVSAELVSAIVEQGYGLLRKAPERIALADIPSPTSHVWADAYYPGAREIALAALRQMDREPSAEFQTVLDGLRSSCPADIPNAKYRDPF